MGRAAAEVAAEAVLLGIDEWTGVLNDRPDDTWTVYGQGGVTVYRGHGVRVYGAGEGFA